MKLHWSSRSPFVRKVMVAAHERGLADRIDLVPQTVALATLSPAVMRDNPLNKIPTLITDDGQALYDSAVICEYLDALAGPPVLFPPAGPARWQALRWHALGNGMLDALILWRGERMRPDGQRAQPVLDAFAAKLAAALDLAARETPALAAAPFGIGHVALGCALGYLDFRFADLAWRDGRAALAAWEAGFVARPSAQATLPRD